jgi:hypothetical protein
MALPGRTRALPALGAVLLLGSLGVAACSQPAGTSSATPTGLAAYTDKGDGCDQVVSAISYAEFVLKPLGQEPYQEWTDEARSRVSAVNGTGALEVRDFPTKEILEQAERTGDLAHRATAAGVAPADRTRYLREYRREAAQLVLLCAPYVDPTPSPSPSASG